MLKIFDQWKDKRNEAIIKVSYSGEPLIKENLDKMSEEQLDFALVRFISPRLIKSVNSNWCTVPNHSFKKMGGLNFLLRCNYDTRSFNDLPAFYKKILENFNELKYLYAYCQSQDIILSNNKEILIGVKQIFLSEWFKKGIISIKDL